MWFEEAVFYQIYPLGFCGAPFENDGIPESRILKVNDWIPHIKNLGINAIYFSPVFESDTHGYNTRDYGLIDTRLGTNEDLIYVCIRHKYISIYFNGGGLVAKVVSDSCNPMNCSLPGSSVYGLLQARILEWVAISFSRASSQPRN